MNSLLLILVTVMTLLNTQSTRTQEHPILTNKERKILYQLSINPLYNRLNMELVDSRFYCNAYMYSCGEWTAHDILVRGPYRPERSFWNPMSLIDRSDKTDSCKKFLASIYQEMKKIKKDHTSSSHQ